MAEGDVNKMRNVQNTEKQTYAIQIECGKISIIGGTHCSEGWCRESGCDFPSCAIFTGEGFDSIDEAKKVYPNIEIV